MTLFSKRPARVWRAGMQVSAPNAKDLLTENRQTVLLPGRRLITRSVTRIPGTMASRWTAPWYRLSARAGLLLVASLGCTALAGTGVASPGVSEKAGNRALELARVFTDNAVLQRDQPCIVYGRDVPGTTVTVTFTEATGSTLADASGHWRVTLRPLPATSTPATMTIVGSSRKVLNNVVVGDVWLISGQSNADFPLSSAEGGSAAALSATNSMIRLLLLEESPRTDARAWTAAEVARLNSKDFFTGSWAVCNPEHAKRTSAIGYFFARYIQANQNVPIGLIDCTVGGTPAASWMSPQTIESHPGTAKIAGHFLDSEMIPGFVRKRMLQNLAEWAAAGGTSPMPEHPYKPGSCWRLGFGELAPFTLRGILWYQGETDADFSDPAEYKSMADRYVATFTALVAGWRTAWEKPNLPVYFVQLPQIKRPSWPWFREAQAQCSQVVSNSAMAVAFDYGDPDNVHPTRKEPVGERLALIARALSYGQAIEWSGPIYRRHRVEGSQAVVEFNHTGGGLVSNDGQPLRFFEVAGADGTFYPARASIVGDAVWVSSPAVPHPEAVRYAWVPAGKVNFYNHARLPAAPFRTRTSESGL
jgi:sialate O-acetylesterase